MNDQVSEDMTSETCTAGTRYKYTMDGPQHPSGFDPTEYFSTYNEFHNVNGPNNDLYGSLLQVVQRHYCSNYCKKSNKPTGNNPTGVLDSMTCVVEEKTWNITSNENGPAELPSCRFDYPLPINKRGACMKVIEYILYYDEEGNSTFGYKLPMNSLRNDRWIDSHMR